MKRSIYLIFSILVISLLVDSNLQALSYSSAEAETELVSANNVNTDIVDNNDSSAMKSGKLNVIIIAFAIFILLVYLLVLNKKTALKLKLRGKILSIAFVLLILMTGLAAISYVYMKSIGDELYSIAEEDIPLTNKISNIEIHQLEQSILIERILKHAHNTNIEDEGKLKLLVDLEKEFVEISHIADKELLQAEEICEQTINHEKDEAKITEFKNVKKTLLVIDAEHKDFEENAIKLFESIAMHNMGLMNKYELIIEQEEAHMTHEIDSLLQVIMDFTNTAVHSAANHEKEAININNIFLVIGLSIGMVLSYSISSLIIKPIRKTINLSQEIAKGDLTQTFEHNQNDEIGQMIDALSTMAVKLQQIISEVKQGSENIAAVSSQMSDSSQEISKGASEHASSVEEISSTMEQIAANIEQNTENASETKKIATIAEQGIKEINNQSAETVEANKLIAEKINIINDIASQTNILALNASVEAARAGEHGRGFNVVAIEVRKLAERSKFAADEIIGLAKNSYHLAEKAGQKMDDILPEVSKTNDLVHEISSASIEQNNGATEINGAIQQLSMVSQQNAASSEELASSAEEMNSQAEQLKELVHFFKVD